MKKISLFVLFNFLSLMTWAQVTGNGGIKMADKLRSSGKIYVVVLVLVIILTGLFIYLVSLDRKIGKLEKEIKSNQKN